MTAPARVHQADVTRVVKGCIDGGMAVGTVRVLPDGEIRVYAGAADSAPPDSSNIAANSLDRLLSDALPAR